MKKLCVVIPLHKPDPGRFELISFMQCFKILGNYPIYIVTNTTCSVSKYEAAVNQKVNVIRVEDHFLSSINGYNKLKLSQYFYRLFDQYEYLLTYELDAFVFRNDLDYWCDKAYDYIGAPWFKGYAAGHSVEMAGVGNSGFSLRRIRSVQQAIRKTFYRDPARYEGSAKSKLRAYLREPYAWLKNQSSENYTIQDAYFVHEDLVLSQFFGSNSGYRLAPTEDAARFSFEVYPEMLYRHNNNQLPTGCRGWYKYEPDFWKPFIESYGYTL